MYKFYDVYQYITNLLLLKKGVVMQLSSVIIDFYLFHDGQVDRQIYI